MLSSLISYRSSSTSSRWLPPAWHPLSNFQFSYAFQALRIFPYSLLPSTRDARARSLLPFPRHFIPRLSPSRSLHGWPASSQSFPLTPSFHVALLLARQRRSRINRSRIRLGASATRERGKRTFKSDLSSSSPRSPKWSFVMIPAQPLGTRAISGIASRIASVLRLVCTYSARAKCQIRSGRRAKARVFRRSNAYNYDAWFLRQCVEESLIDRPKSSEFYINANGRPIFLGGFFHVNYNVPNFTFTYNYNVHVTLTIPGPIRRPNPAGILILCATEWSHFLTMRLFPFSLLLVVPVSAGPEMPARIVDAFTQPEREIDAILRRFNLRAILSHPRTAVSIPALHL